MTLDDAIIKGNDAKAVLENPVVKLAFDRLYEAIIQQAKTCDPDDEKKTQRVILGIQIYEGFKREFERIIEEGEVAKIQLDELNTKSTLKRFIR